MVCKLSVCIVARSAMVDKVIAVETKLHPLLCHISICYIVDDARCWLMFDLIGVGRPSIAISDTSLVFPSDDNM